MTSPGSGETLTHRLILPRDANHHGTLYAGVLLSLALEAAYATGYRSLGDSANLVLKRVLDLRCFEPVPIGRVVELRGREVHRSKAQVVVALRGVPLVGRSRDWMDGLMQFVQVNADGQPVPLVDGNDDTEPGTIEPPPEWLELGRRARQLLAIRVRPG
jgi:acyl-CoA thioesterase YciA